MWETEKFYSLEKSMMLNVLYDTLERLGVCVISSNSERGRIQFRINGTELVLKINTIYPQETVRVTVTSQTKELDDAFVNALFDEISSTISVIKAKSVY